MSSHASHVRAALKAKQDRWMDERARTTELESVRSSLSVPQSDGTSLVTSAAALSDDKILNQLTAKISDRLRTTLVSDLRKSASLTPEENANLASKMEDYLHGELSTHQCKICFELMMPPSHTPTLLFPCGHTFCSACADRNASASSSPKCPYCRSPITSSAVNHSLKDLILRFASQQTALRSGKVESLDDVFGGEAKDEKDMAGKDKYLSEWRGCMIRRSVLNHELEDERSRLGALVGRKVAVQGSVKVLREEMEKAEERRREVEAELELVARHLADATSKQSKIEEEESCMVKKIKLVERTVEGLEGEIEKARALAEGCGALQAEFEEGKDEYEEEGEGKR